MPSGTGWSCETRDCAYEIVPTPGIREDKAPILEDDCLQISQQLHRFMGSAVYKELWSFGLLFPSASPHLHLARRTWSKLIRVSLYLRGSSVN